MPTALIIGSAGQDGVLLARLLRAKGYLLVLADRAPAATETIPLDIEDAESVRAAFSRWRPDEVYFLAAHHASSEQTPLALGELVRRSLAVNTIGLNNVLAACLELPGVRIFYAASCRVFGSCAPSPQRELTPMAPSDAYGISKAAGVQLCRLYRKRGVYCTAGILFNHESPLRGPEFVSRKIVRAAVSISRGHQDALILGSLDHRSDWGAAEDYVAAMWATLQLAGPDEFIIASGSTHAVRDWVEIAFDAVGLDWREYVAEDPSLVKDASPGVVWCGDNSKLKAATGWSPTVDFATLVRNLVQAEIEGQPARVNPGRATERPPHRF